MGSDLDASGWPDFVSHWHDMGIDCGHCSLNDVVLSYI